MFRVGLMVLFLAALSGCASQSARELTLKEHSDYAGLFLGINHCLAGGLIDGDTAAWGRRYTQNDLNRYIHYPKLIEDEIQRMGAMTKGVEPYFCNELKVYVADRKTQTEINNSNVQRTERSIESSRSEEDKSFFCNSVGTMTICNDM